MGEATDIYSFQMDVDFDSFLQIFWHEKEWLFSFLSHKLEDEEIIIGEWKNEGEHQIRNISTTHVTKSFVGYSNTTNSFKEQKMIIKESENSKGCVVYERNSFKGMQLLECFVIDVVWNINESESGSSITNVYITATVIFNQSSWLQSTIESNSIAELRRVYSLWHSHAEDYISNKIKQNEFADAFSPFKSEYYEEEIEFYDCKEFDNELRRRVSHDSLTNVYNSSEFDDRVEYHGRYNSHAIANGVEITLLIGEVLFWNLHSIYTNDIKSLYSIEPGEFVSRAYHSFIPGGLTPVLSRPDLYGPTIALLALPQALVIAMDSSHHGCSRSILLGDAVLVSLSLLFGLSMLYRMYAFLVAPNITFKHCISIVGYSMFAWLAAILFSTFLETEYLTIGIPPQLSIVLFGIPAALAQGYVFYQSTPILLTHNHIPSYFRRLAHDNTSFTTNLLWILPKAIIFALVAGTHYQILWYIARVFLPGRKHYCNLSALINPANYADIISQKEFRQFAVNFVRQNIEK